MALPSYCRTGKSPAKDISPKPVEKARILNAVFPEQPERRSRRLIHEIQGGVSPSALTLTPA